MRKGAFVDPSDTEMLDWLNSKSGGYTGKVAFRWSTTGRGWRLHETTGIGYYSVREAIAAAMLEEERQHVTQVCLACHLRQPIGGACRRCGSNVSAKGVTRG